MGNPPPVQTNENIVDDAAKAQRNLRSLVEGLRNPNANVDPETRKILEQRWKNQQEHGKKVHESIGSIGKGNRSILDANNTGGKRISQIGSLPKGATSPGQSQQGASMPTSPQMPTTPTASPQASNPASGANTNAGTNMGKPTMIPSSTLEKLLKNYHPSNDKSNDEDSNEESTSPRETKPIDPSNVIKRPTGYGILKKSELKALAHYACDLHGITDETAREKITTLMNFIAWHESGGNPDAVNKWDSNAHGTIAEDGAPEGSSRNLYQEIPSTFAHYHVAGTSWNIYDMRAAAASDLGYLLANYIKKDGSGVDEFIAKRSGQYSGY